MYVWITRFSLTSTAISSSKSVSTAKGTDDCGATKILCFSLSIVYKVWHRSGQCFRVNEGTKGLRFVYLGLLATTFCLDTLIYKSNFNIIFIIRSKFNCGINLRDNFYFSQQIFRFVFYFQTFAEWLTFDLKIYFRGIHFHFQYVKLDFLNSIIIYFIFQISEYKHKSV